MFRRQGFARLFAVSSIALSFPFASVSRAEPGSPVNAQQALIDRVDALQAQVKALQLQLQQTRPGDQQNDRHDAAALRQEADRASGSDTPSSSLFTAGYHNGRFVIQSTDGSYVLHPWLQLQARYETSYRKRGADGGRFADTQSGFEIRRLKLGFDGSVISPDLTYMFQFAADRKTGTVALEQAFGKYHLPGTPFYLKVGQYKEPLDHEQLLASRYLTAIDRTVTDDLFFNGEGFVQGASVGFENGGALRGVLAITDGQRSGNTGFQSFPTNPANYGLAGRADLKLLGNWHDYDRTTGAYGVSGTFLVLGAGGDYTEAGDTHVITHVADVSFGNAQGFALYGAYTGRAFQHAALGSLGTDGGTTGKTPSSNGYDFSFRAQASYAIDEHWEPYAQYEFIHLDARGVPSGANHDVQVLRAGANYYLFNTQARLSFDVSYLPDGSPLGDDGNGILPTGASPKSGAVSHGGGEVVFRTQLQLAL